MGHTGADSAFCRPGIITCGSINSTTKRAFLVCFSKLYPKDKPRRATYLYRNGEDETWQEETHPTGDWFVRLDDDDNPATVMMEPRKKA